MTSLEKPHFSRASPDKGLRDSQQDGEGSGNHILQRLGEGSCNVSHEDQGENGRCPPVSAGLSGTEERSRFV